MKKYLLLASVAGCLLSAGNAWATDWISVGTIEGQTLNKTSATLTAKAKIIKTVCANVGDMDFGTFVLNPSTADGDQIATLSDGIVTPVSSKVSIHKAPESDIGNNTINISSGGQFVTGVNFTSTTIDLKSGADTVAQVYDIGASEKQGDSDTGYYFLLNGKLKVTDLSAIVRDDAELSGTTTVSLDF